MGRVMRQIDQKGTVFVCFNELFGKGCEIILPLAALDSGWFGIGRSGVIHVETMLKGAETITADIAISPLRQSRIQRP